MKPVSPARPLDCEGGEADPAAAQKRADAELVELVLQDPPAGLAALHARLAKDINRLVWRLLGADAEHDDIVQQVFFRVLTSIHRLKNPERLNFWVRAITVNTVRAELRRRAVRRAFWFSHSQAQPHGDLTREVEARDFLSVALQLLERLPSQERIVFVLYYVEELSLPEVAELCGYSLMTAKRRLGAARRRFETMVASRPELAARFRSMGGGS